MKRIGSRTLEDEKGRTSQRIGGEERRREPKPTDRRCDLRFVRSQVSPARRIVTFGSFRESNIAKMGLSRYSVDAWESSDEGEAKDVVVSEERREGEESARSRTSVPP